MVGREGVEFVVHHPAPHVLARVVLGEGVEDRPQPVAGGRRRIIGVVDRRENRAMTGVGDLEQQLLLGAEVHVDRRRTHLRAVGDVPRGRPVEPLGRERLDGGAQEPGPGGHGPDFGRRIGRRAHGHLLGTVGLVIATSP